VTITLNGDPFDMPTPLTVTQLLEQLRIDSRRVAVEHNFIVLKRMAYETTQLAEGDQVEIVNFVGGGEAVRTLR
jgi:sulfur carrier protein